MATLDESYARAAVAQSTLSLLQQKAIDKLEKLESVIWNTVWKVDKFPIFDGVARRIVDPGQIQQGSAGLCGPASALYDYAKRDPEGYATFVADLYERGKGKFGTLLVKPSELLTNAEIPLGVPAADWIPMASLRNSENDAFEYISDKNQFQGITLPREMKAWFKALGYRDVKEKAHLVKLGRSTLALAEEASRLFDEGYRVALFVNADGARSEAIRVKRGSLIPNHWVVLTSTMFLSTDQVFFDVFSWGEGKYKVPQPTRGGNPPLNLETFLDNFYGFVAARF